MCIMHNVAIIPKHDSEIQGRILRLTLLPLASLISETSSLSITISYSSFEYNPSISAIPSLSLFREHKLPPEFAIPKHIIRIQLQDYMGKE